MIGRFRIVVCAVLPLVASLLGGVAIAAQETPAACPSALWLEALTAEQRNAAATTVAADAPAWLSTALTDACSGETFTLADFAGKTIYLESMATWCPPCRDQLARAKDAAAQIPEDQREEFVFVALSSEVDLPREALAEYAATNDFPFAFAVMPAEMLQAMAEDLGQEIAVPPATPHLIISPDGTVGELRTGSEPAEEILRLLNEASGE